MIVSIIVPVFNSEEWLPFCLESIIKQTISDWELILVDDGSTDKSGTICDEYAARDERISVIHAENKGVSQARNIGLKMARAPFVTFIDADDRIRSGYLSNFSYDPEFDFEIQGFTLTKGFDAEGFKIVEPNQTRSTTLKDAYCEAELKKLSRGPYCKLFKRGIIAQNQLEFPVGIQFGEDAIFVKHYLLHCDFSKRARTIAQADYLYNHHDGYSLTNQRHGGEAFYSMANCDYHLFMELQTLWGAFPECLIEDFTRIRFLEFYQSIVLFFSEKHSLIKKREFLTEIKNGLFKDIQNYKSLPVTYSIIRGILLYCPTGFASIILSIIAPILAR